MKQTHTHSPAENHAIHKQLPKVAPCTIKLLYPTHVWFQVTLAGLDWIEFRFELLVLVGSPLRHKPNHQTANK